MTIKEYSLEASKTMIYDCERKQLVCGALGLVGEAGEVAEKIKKMIRDNDWKIDWAITTSIEKELGDVLWYVNTLALTFGIPLERIFETNIEKLKSRKERGVINGNGDER